MLLLLLLSHSSIFYLLTYTIAIFNTNKCMVELMDFLLKDLQAFFIQLGFVVFSSLNLQMSVYIRGKKLLPVCYRF